MLMALVIRYLARKKGEERVFSWNCCVNMAFQEHDVGGVNIKVMRRDWSCPVVRVSGG